MICDIRVCDQELGKGVKNVNKCSSGWASGTESKLISKVVTVFRAWKDRVEKRLNYRNVSYRIVVSGQKKSSTI